MRMLKLWGVALVAALTLAACDRDDGMAADEEARTLEVYEVPASQLMPVRQALDRVLRADETGSVSDSDGRLLVLAPPSTQASIGKAIETLVQPHANAERALDTPIRLRIWLVAGSTEPAPADPRVEPLRPALEAASQGLGLQGYRLQGFTEVLTAHTQGFNSATSNLVVRGGTRLSDTGVTLDIDMDMKHNDVEWGARIETQALVQPGQFLVLGTSAADDGSMRLVVAQAQLPGDAP